MRVALASCDPYPPVVDDEEPLREALRAHGFEVVDAPWDDARFDWSACAAVLLRTTWDYQDKAAAFVAWCERTSAVTSLIHGPEVVRWNIDKRYLAALEAQGVPIAPTVWLAGGESEATLAHATSGWNRGFLKPVIGANACATLRFTRDAAGLAAAAAHVADGEARGGFMLQPYIASVEALGELSVIVIEGEPCHGVRKVPAAGDFRVQEDWGARDEAWAPDGDALALAARAMAVAEALVGAPLAYGRVDLLAHDGGYVLNELEVIEPALFFRHGRRAAERLAAAVARTVARGRARATS